MWCFTDTEVEVRSPLLRDNTAVITCAVIGGVCLIFGSPVVFLLFSLNCKRYVLVSSQCEVFVEGALLVHTHKIHIHNCLI